MFFFLQQLSVRSITTPSLCHCNIHEFPGERNSSRWPLAMAQTGRKKYKCTKGISKRKGFCIWSLFLCLLVVTLCGVSLTRLGNGAAPSLASSGASGGKVTPSEGLHGVRISTSKRDWKAWQGCSGSRLSDAHPAETSVHPGTEPMPRAGPCHSPAPHAGSKMIIIKQALCDLSLHPPPWLSLLNSSLILLVFTAVRSVFEV